MVFSKVASDTTLFVCTFRSGYVIANLDGKAATDLFYEAQNTDDPCTVTLQNTSYRAP